VWRVLTGGRRVRPAAVTAPVPQGDPAAA
jgi:hypothetical protein